MLLKLKLYKKIFRKKQNSSDINTCEYVRGDYRLSKGLYYTPLEKEKYIKKSLRRKLK